MPVTAGAALPLGVSALQGGVNFALWSSRATRVELCLFDPDSGAELQRFDLPGRSGDTWHGLVPAPHAGSGTHYGFRVHGPDPPQPGDRFDPQIPLLDPYARAICKKTPLRSVVVDTAFDWAGDRSPAIAWCNTVLYELHVKGFTALHPGVPQIWRGK
jgi:pullulanase/glycogen debranching enzyme